MEQQVHLLLDPNIYGSTTAEYPFESVFAVFVKTQDPNGYGDMNIYEPERLRKMTRQVPRRPSCTTTSTTLKFDYTAKRQVPLPSLDDREYHDT